MNFTDRKRDGTPCVIIFQWVGQGIYMKKVLSIKKTLFQFVFDPLIRILKKWRHYLALYMFKYWVIQGIDKHTFRDVWKKNVLKMSQNPHEKKHEAISFFSKVTCLIILRYHWEEPFSAPISNYFSK